jgi:glutamyl-tRNA(Gln) amidotransferase subunit D
MTQNKLIKEKLDKIGAKTGDRISVETKRVKKEGVLMPHHQFSDPYIINIKLDNGYNIGISADKNTKIILVKKNKTSVKKPKEIPYDKSKPTISVIGTGGTIACYVDYRTGAVHPASSAKDLAFSVPEVFDICNFKTQVAFQILSENIEVLHWKTLAGEVAKELNSGAVGVIIPHGTDTLGYTGAALSFMLQNLSGPVVLVGAQRSSDRPSSDAAFNLISAVAVASKTDLGEVVAVMHEEISDSVNAIHRGTKVRKFHTSRRDAFKSVNDIPLGIVEKSDVKFNKEYRKKSKGKVIVDDKIESDVAMIYSYPGLKPSDIPDKKGIVFIGTGLGHVPNKVIPRIKELSSKGTIFAMTSQCLFGRVNMKVYSTGRDLLKTGIIPCEDMLPETAYVKLMWALGHSKKHGEVEKIMKTNISGEMTERTRSDVFL